MIVLINPPFVRKSTEFFNYYRARYPHPSLAGIAGYLEQRGVNIKIIDSKFNNLDFQDILTLLKKFNPRIIGFTSNTSEIKTTHLLIQYIKKELAEPFFILGGVHSCALPEETLEANPYLDAVAFTEGEEILWQLAASRDINATLPEIEGIVYRDNGRIVKNRPRVLPATMDDYGPMALHHWPGAERYHVQTYRGCPFPCSFCFRATGKKPRLRKIDNIIADLEYIASVSPEGAVDFADATFGLNREHTEKVLHEMIRRGLHRRLRWGCGTRVDVGTPELFKLIKEAGGYIISFGIESGSDRILRLTGKNINLEKASQLIQEAKQAGLETVGYYVLGHIDETKEEVKQTIKAIWKNNTNKISIGVMVPWPGTKVYKLAKENQGGYSLLSEDYEKFDKYFGGVMQFNNFSLRYLDIMRIVAYIKLYLYNFRLRDLCSFVFANSERAVKKVKQIAKNYQ
jgi:anaerobic magnesium-protoporphyrin IX monomethyl ester cyclase